MDPLAELRKAHFNEAGAKYQGGDYKDRYIAFLDVLGMHGLVKEAYANVSSVFQIVEATRLDYVRASLPGGQALVSDKQLNVTVMSDSVVVSIDASVARAFTKMIGFCSCVIKDLICKPESPIFIRGGIVRGDIHHQGEIVFGPGLVEAYKLESEVAKTMRCILSPALCKQQDVQNYIEQHGDSLPYDEDDGFRFVNFIHHDNQRLLSSAVSKVLIEVDNVKVRSKYIWLDQRLRHLA